MNQKEDIVYVGKTSKKTQAYESIKEMIISGKIQENLFISERALSSVLGISRTPIKAALNELCAERLVVEYPGKGFMVAHITSEDVDEIYQIRELLDPLALRLTMEKDIQGNIKNELIACVKNMKLALAEKKWAEIGQWDMAFHDCYFNYTGNSRLSDVLFMLRTQIRRFIFSIQDNKDRQEQSYQEHQDIIDKLMDDDIDGACAALVKHLVLSREFHKKMLKIRRY